jgi:hypothetical protein
MSADFYGGTVDFADAKFSRVTVIFGEREKDRL